MLTDKFTWPIIYGVNTRLLFQVLDAIIQQLDCFSIFIFDTSLLFLDLLDHCVFSIPTIVRVGANIADEVFIFL